MTESGDLSQGDVAADDLERPKLEIREERQRLRWKTGILVGGAVTVVLFYVLALFFKVIGKTDGMTPEDFDNHPFVRLVREVLATFTQK